MKQTLGLLGVLVLFLGGLLANTFSSSPLAAAPPLDAPLPPASPPSGMDLRQIPTGVIHRNAGVAYRGGSLWEARDFAMTAALVRHPSGDLLIDTGLGRNIDAQVMLLPWWFRMASPLDRVSPAAGQLDAVAYDRRRLMGILLTHAHWDHASGLPDFPDTPVLVNDEERRFIEVGGMVTAVARSAVGAHYQLYQFEGGPYLGFPRSHDVHGDGSVVVVPAAGHTPGSVIVFVTLPTRARFAFVGDLAWQREGILQREERPWFLRTGVDHDPDGVRSMLQQMSAVVQRYPDITLVPAHDARAFEGIPTL